LFRAPRGAGGLTIDLGGKQLRGSGHGIGVWVIDGGAGGATVISSGRRARIDGFMDGLVAHGLHTVALVANLGVHDSARDGVRIDARGYVVHDTEVLDAGRDGFSLGGDGFRVTATTALHSHRFGYFIRGRRGNVGRPGAGNTARDSGEAGFNVTGRAHHLVECAAIGGGHDGIRLSGMGDTLVRCRAAGNAGTGIVGSGMHVMLAGNQATSNGDSGVLIHGADLRDGGGNRAGANGNAHHPAGAAQCSIGGVACGP
jgi:hypothetical protein